MLFDTVFNHRLKIKVLAGGFSLAMRAITLKTAMQNDGRNAGEQHVTG